MPNPYTDSKSSTEEDNDYIFFDFDVPEYSSTVYKTPADGGVVFVFLNKGDYLTVSIADFDAGIDSCQENTIRSIYDRKFCSFTFRADKHPEFLNTLTGGVNINKVKEAVNACMSDNGFHQNNEGFLYSREDTEAGFKRTFGKYELWVKPDETVYNLTAQPNKSRTPASLNIIVDSPKKSRKTKEWEVNFTLCYGFGVNGDDDEEVLATKGRKQFISARVTLPENIQEQQNYINAAISKIESVFANSVDDNNFMHRIKPVGGEFTGEAFDHEMQKSFRAVRVLKTPPPAKARKGKKLKNNQSKVLTAWNAPAAYGLVALKELGDINIIGTKYDSKGQFKHSIYGNKKLTITTVSVDNYGTGSYEISPQLWLIPGKDNGIGIKALVKKLAETEVIDAPSSEKELIQFVDDKVKAMIGVLKASGYDIVKNAKAKAGMRVFPRLAPQVKVEKNPVTDIDIFNARGLSPQTLQKCRSQKLLYHGDSSVIANMHKGLALTPTLPCAQQKFAIEGSGKVSKMYYKKGNTKGASWTIRGANANTAVMTEAIFDAAATHDLFALAGEDTEKYHFSSMMSAGNLTDWLTELCGIRLPNDKEVTQGHIGFFVTSEYSEKTPEEAKDLITSTFASAAEDGDCIVFVDDGSEQSKKALATFNNLLEFSGYDGEVKIHYSRDRSYAAAKYNTVILDYTNIHETIAAAGLKECDNGTFSLNVVNKVNKSIEQKDYEKAKTMIVEKSGVSNFILAYDNDIAGLHWTERFEKLMHSVGVSASTFIPPFLHMKDEEIGLRDIRNTCVNHKSNPIALPLNNKKNPITNDMNDCLRLATDGTEKQKRLIISSVKRAIDDTMSSLSERLGVCREIAIAFDEKDAAIKTIATRISEKCDQLNEHYKTAFGLKKGKERNAAFEKANVVKADIKQELANLPPEIYEDNLIQTKENIARFISKEKENSAQQRRIPKKTSSRATAPY